jgi:hypothetical protein
MKFLLLCWDDSDMVGIFKDTNLEQVMNTPKRTFADNLLYLKDLYHCDTLELEFISSHDELNKMRVSRGMEKKPTLDEYLKAVTKENNPYK